MAERLPDEGELPDITPLSGGETSRHDAKDAATARLASHWPSESQAPNAPPDPDPAKKQDDLLQMEKSLDARPWMRILAKGVLGKVRAITFARDSRRLMAAGDSKEVIVWNCEQDAAPLYERTLRWQVQRGERGRISTLAASPDYLALAGNGAMGGNGEIVLFHPQTGDFIAGLADNEQGHRFRVASLAASPEGDAILSMDQAGTLLHWKKDKTSGLWKSHVLATDPQAKQRMEDREFHPVAFLNGAQAIAPRFLQMQTIADKPVPVWELASWDLKTSTVQAMGPDSPRLFGKIASLDVAKQGQKWAAADLTRKMYLADSESGVTRWTSQTLPGVATSMAFSDDGLWLAVGLAMGDKTGKFQLWNVRDMPKPSMAWSIDTAAEIWACDISPNGKWIAFGQPNAVHVLPLQAGQPTQAHVLSSDFRPPFKVGFAKQSDPYVLGFSTESALTDGYEKAFDTQRRQLLSIKEQQQLAWHQSFRPAEWTLDRATNWLMQGGKRVARLPLEKSMHGTVSAECWIADSSGKQPQAVAVGTSANCGVYVFDMAGQLLRQYRGQGGGITSLATSPDGKYIVSGSLDGTAALWKLAGYATDNPQMRRWGLQAEVQQAGAVITHCAEDGPLYFRGLRVGDVIKRLRRPAAGAMQIIEEPKAILAALASVTQDEQVAFEVFRGSLPLKEFQSLPAWHPIASLFFNTQREWAYFTPQGYYDASFEGHRLFGWQVNRGLNVGPDFFLAAQVREYFERPDVMSQLLKEDSMDAVFRKLSAHKSVLPTQTLEDAQRLQPQVAILTPTPGEKIAGVKQQLKATVRVSPGQVLTPPRAFVNGVTGLHRTQTAERKLASVTEYEFTWEMHVPSDRRLLFQVVAGAQPGTLGEAAVICENNASQNLERRPRMHLVTAGIDNYRDGRLKLSYAVKNAEELAKQWQGRCEHLYQASASAYLDDAVTPGGWNQFMERISTSLRNNAHPDDLLVIYLSGHGLRDERTDEYYFVTSQARYSDLLQRRYADCLSFNDLSKFADVPCRKLVILDTCHAGAIRPSTHRDLKEALRALQDDVVITLTASEGTEEAVEDQRNGHGRFTFRLLEALNGRADGALHGQKDGFVSLREAYAYVERTVAQDSMRSTTEQHPTMGPVDLVDFVDIPLSKLSPPVRQALLSPSRQ